MQIPSFGWSRLDIENSLDSKTIQIISKQVLNFIQVLAFPTTQ